ncbi:hypothetical protein [Marinilabilia rubra]|uniref:Glycoside hydrolase family 5 domain-containing protein n=1 Tax=Marinilabilia rubra TaxID=2162893 RepID=A0A2U2B613_9BACT|nr:hypothetical protein [Marinilabilia rubra]PWD98507.1 hypothetical protein DDZ16_14805 [Marinilabilia rubra]
MIRRSHFFWLIFFLLFIGSSACSEDKNEPDPDKKEDPYTPPFHHEGIRLGANFNENIADININNLQYANMQWVRGFVNISNFLNISQSGEITGINENRFNSFTDLNALKNLENYTASNGEPMRIIFSLKLDFKRNDMGVPELGTPGAEYIIQVIERLLITANIASNIDILVVGNEPMWETPNSDVENFKLMLRYLINKVYDWRSQKSDWNYQIYTGALNRVSELAATNPVLQAVFEIASNNDKVEGIDLHPHVDTIEDGEADVKWIRDNGFDKEIIVTEFSLHRLLQSKLRQNLGDWGTQNGYSSDLKMWEWLNILLQNANSDPIDPVVFKSFFLARDWYPDKWFSSFYSAFCEYDVKVATYGFRRPIESPVFQLSSQSPAWVLNAYLNDALLGYNEDGFPVKNPLFKDEWEQIINGEFDCP